MIRGRWVDTRYDGDEQHGFVDDAVLVAQNYFVDDDRLMLGYGHKILVHLRLKSIDFSTRQQ